MPRRKGSPKRLPTTINTSERSLVARRRNLEALHLRVHGDESTGGKPMPYRDIAAKLGFKSPASVHEAVQRLLKEQPKEDVETLRQMENEKLDEYEALLRQLAQANPKFAPRIIEVGVRVMERRAKMHGLDAADKVEHEIKAPRVIEYVRDERQDQRESEVAALLGQPADLPRLPAAREVIDLVPVERGGATE